MPEHRAWSDCDRGRPQRAWLAVHAARPQRRRCVNYRHAYHAGNFADVLKHAVLALALAHLKRKETAFHVLDVHAGTGLYDLAGAEAGKTGEWAGGIGRLIGDAPLDPVLAERLAPYLDVIRALNPNGLRLYPGSPRLALALMRPQDRLTAVELHPEDAAALQRNLAGDPRAKALTLDAYLALKALLPPRERRGLVLIDPPFEAADEFARLIRGLREALKRWATGIYLVWYPIKDPAQTDDFAGRMAEIGLPKTLRAELFADAPKDSRLNGCGLLIVNPPYTLEADLSALGPRLAARLAQGPGREFRLDWLVAER